MTKKDTSAAFQVADTSVRSLLKTHGGTPEHPMDVRLLAKAIGAVAKSDQDRSGAYAAAYSAMRQTRPNSPKQTERAQAIADALGLDDNDRKWVEGEIEKNWDEIADEVQAVLSEDD